MATRGKRSTAPARKARRPASRKPTRARRAALAVARRRRASSRPAKAAARSGSNGRSGGLVVRRSVHPIARVVGGWSTLRVVWRPAIAMATLPYRVYRVYRWAEAERIRSRSAPTSAP